MFRCGPLQIWRRCFPAPQHHHPPSKVAPSPRPPTPPLQPSPSPFHYAGAPTSYPLASVTLESLKAAAARGEREVRFGLHATREACKVIKVYDGDSVTLAWRRAGAGAGAADVGAPDAFCYANCRLYGIDTPELRGTSGQQRLDAEACRDTVRSIALGELFLFTTVGETGLDKYGRPLVVLYAAPGLTSPRTCNIVAGHESVNQWALHALPGCKAYFGGTKEGSA